MPAEAAEVDLGTGLFTRSEASRLLRMTPDRLARWLSGYRYRLRSGEARQQTSVVNPDLPTCAGVQALTFADLVEVLFAKRFLDHGVKMRLVRRVEREAAQELGVSHPFATRRFVTDGRTILMRIPHAIALRDMATDQFVFRAVFDPLLKQLDYDELEKVAARWWPLGREHGVVIDPHRRFGEPVVAKGGIPTRVLHAAHQAGEPHARIVKWFGVSEDELNDAIAYESSFSRAA